MSRQLPADLWNNRAARDRYDYEQRQWKERGDMERRDRHERATLSSNVDTFAAAADIANVRLSKESIKKLLCAFSDLGYSLKP